MVVLQSSTENEDQPSTAIAAWTYKVHFGVFKIWYSILEPAGCTVQLSEKEDTFTDMVIFIMVYLLP